MTARNILQCSLSLAALLLLPLLGATSVGADDKKTDAPKVTKVTKEDKKTPASKIPDRAALEKAFEQSLTNSTLTGSFTIAGKEDESPKKERYTISSVSKIKGDTWLFKARVQYGKYDVTVPMPLEVHWAGDTPVITLTDLAIPGLGTFTARVIIYRGQYAGTWQHGTVGGHLFGKIEKNPTSATPMN